MCSIIRPAKKAHCFKFFFQPSIFLMPRRVAFTKTFFWLIWHSSSEIHALQVCSIVLPRKKGPLFQFFFIQGFS